MTLVLDSSAAVAALLDDGPVGRQALQAVREGGLVAPHILPAEVTNVVRRLAAAGEVSSDAGVLALDDLSALAIGYVPFDPFRGRVWELRGAVAAYDAWYVAVAEALDAPLATLDGRLMRASGPRCAWALSLQ
jgi:predicted nucleic acid-binding protein